MMAQGREDARRLQPGVCREDVRDASRPRLEPLATHRTLSDRREVSRILSVRGTLGSSGALHSNTKSRPPPKNITNG